MKVLLLILLLLAAACTADRPVVDDPTASLACDSVRIRFSSPAYYDLTERGRTRTSLEDTLSHLPLHSMKEGTTLWILVQRLDADPASATYGTYVNEDISNAYVVIYNDDFGYDLVPCLTDADGNVLEYSGTVLYLRPGTYRFRCVSPAYRLTSDTLNGVARNYIIEVLNGMQLLATDDRYPGYTSPLPFTVPTQEEIAADEHFNAANGVYEVEVAHLVNQTARLKFDVVVDPDDADALRYIHSVEPMSSGCEITGLYKADIFDWTALNTEGALHTYLNLKDDKYAIAGDAFKHIDDNPTSLVCSTCIIPTDARSSILIVAFNLRVNNVPTQYMTSIANTKFEQGFTYHYRIKLSMKEGVVVANWYNESASKELILE